MSNRAALAVAIGMSFGLTASSWANQPLTADAILSETLRSYSTAKTLRDVTSIEAWCRDSLEALNYQRNDFLLKRSTSFVDQSKAAAILNTVASLQKLDEQETDLLCAPGALQ